MSPLGNRLVAALIAETLDQIRVAPPVDDRPEMAQEEPSDGRNLLPLSEALDRAMPATSHAAINAIRVSKGASQEFRLSTQGATGEHYIALRVLLENGLNERCAV